MVSTRIIRRWIAWHFDLHAAWQYALLSLTGGWLLDGFARWLTQP